MKGYVFNNDDFIQIDNLIKITSSIDSIYSKLYDLEIKGKKDTDDYRKLIDELKLSIEIENRQYEDCNLNYWKCVAWHHYFINKKVPVGFVDNTESIVKHNYNYRIMRRIISKLEKRMTTDYENIKETLPPDLEKQLKELGLYNDNNFLSKMVDSGTDVLESLELDILNAYLTILEEFIDNKDYNYLKNELINSKYNLSFIKGKIESDMISNNFEVSDTIYINSKFYADLIYLDFKSYNNLRNLYNEENVMNQINNLLEIGDMDYSDNAKICTSVLRQCYIRATLLTMGNDMISKINSKFNKQIKDEKYLQKHQFDRISKQLIENCFNNVEKDREKVSIITLSLR